MIPILLVPGLGCSARLYAGQIPALWRLGKVAIANHTNADTLAGIAKSILDNAPPRFHLAGMSMGGYIAFEILRQAPERVARLALIDTASRADTAEQTERRKKLIAMAEQDRLTLVNEVLWPLLVHESRATDRDLRTTVDQMLFEVGAAAFIRQQQALISRPDSRPGFAAIRSPTLVIVGDSDRLTPPELSVEMTQGIHGAVLEIIADCGHHSTLERPERVTKLLVEWFSG
jgi:pimeloyl-ACP methyl ester carboxylesterase